MKFINRTAELQQLHRLSDQSNGGLAVLWGRRRVGKTRLLLEWANRTKGLYIVCDESAPSVQRKYMAERLAQKFPGFNDVDYPDWTSLFNRISREAQLIGWHGPLIIDELPYLAAASKEIASILQRWIDHEAKQAGLNVAIAGSSQRMMQGIVLDRSAPLFGRAAVSMQVRSLPAGFIRQTFGLADDVQAVKAFSIWGGMPRYWELAQPFGADLFAAVDALLLNPTGPLHHELDTLLLEELPPAMSLRPILDCIGLGSHRVSEIAGRIAQPATSLTRPLNRLIEMGLIKREIPFGESEKTGKKALYKLTDPFVRAWFDLVAANRSALANAPLKLRQAIWTKHNQSLFATTWEELCRQSVSHLTPDQTGPWLPAQRFWKANEAEWDVVSTSLEKTRTMLGEVKWSEKPFRAREISQLFGQMKSKPKPPIPHLPSDTIYALFLPQAEKTTELDKGCRVITAENVMATLNDDSHNR